MRLKLLALAVLLLLFAGCTMRRPAAGTCPVGTAWNAGFNCCVDGALVCMQNSTATTLMLWEDWQQMAFLVVLMGFLLMGLMYMVAYAFDFKEVMIFVKNEMIQLAVSAFILGNVLFFVFLLDSLAEENSVYILGMHSNVTDITSDLIKNPDGSWTVQNTQNAINVSEYRPADGRWNIVQKNPGDTIDCPSPCHIYLARGYLGMTYERIAVMARSVIKSYSSLVWIDRTRVGVFINIMGVVAQIAVTLMPFTGLSIIYHSLGTCFDFMAKAMIALKFQESMLMYIESGIFPLFLIVGIILRSVWFLRKLGGLMIAIAIGLYTVLPLLYVLCWYTVDSSTVTLQIDSDMIQNGDFSVPLLPWQSSNLDAGALEDFLFTKYNADNTVDTMGLLDITSSLMLPAFAIPLLNIFITIAFIKTLSASIGGDMELAGLTRII
ncbi:MAG: hypothetical protein ABIG39_04000 [Candidatus Micrarchaeota archaeon]